MEPGTVHFDFGVGNGGLGDLEFVLGGVKLLLAGGLHRIEPGEAVALAGGELNAGFEAVEIADGFAVEGSRFMDVSVISQGLSGNNYYIDASHLQVVYVRPSIAKSSK